jgi:hypothetical protein
LLFFIIVVVEYHLTAYFQMSGLFWLLVAMWSIQMLVTSGMTIQSLNAMLDGAGIACKMCPRAACLSNGTLVGVGGAGVVGGRCAPNVAAAELSGVDELLLRGLKIGQWHLLNDRTVRRIEMRNVVIGGGFPCVSNAAYTCHQSELYLTNTSLIDIVFDDVFLDAFGAYGYASLVIESNNGERLIVCRHAPHLNPNNLIRVAKRRFKDNQGDG